MPKSYNSTGHLISLSIHYVTAKLTSWVDVVERKKRASSKGEMFFCEHYWKHVISKIWLSITVEQSHGFINDNKTSEKTNQCIRAENSIFAVRSNTGQYGAENWIQMLFGEFVLSKCLEREYYKEPKTIYHIKSICFISVYHYWTNPQIRWTTPTLLVSKGGETGLSHLTDGVKKIYERSKILPIRLLELYFND